MLVVFSRKFLLFILIILSIICTISFEYSIAQGNNNGFLYPSYVNKYQYEIGRIDFVGSHAFSYSELEAIITSRPTSRNYAHKILLYYDIEMKYQNLQVFIPSILIQSLDDALKTMLNEVNFFEQIKAENDVLSLKDFYNQNGYHDVEVSYTFEPGYSSQLNVLTFHINEHSVYRIKSLNFIGLDSLTSQLEYNFKSVCKVKPGNIFNENLINTEVRAIHYMLLDNGYFYANFDMPLVLKDSVLSLDSTIIVFRTGIRQKISEIDYIDSLRGQKAVAKDMKDKQLDFAPGDWYSISKFNRTNNNLFSLGTFDIVSIDTSSLFAPKTDSTLPITVFTQYRKQQEWGFSGYINRTAFDNFTNIGLEGSYSNRNIGGIAQNINIFARGGLQDISRGLNSEIQLQAGINFAQPLLWVIDKARIGSAGQLTYTLSNINTDLQLSDISMPLRLPIKFLDITFIQFGSIDFLIQRQVPLNFSDAYNKALDSAKTKEDSVKTITSYKLYESLDRYKQKTGFLVPTAFIFGGSLIGDKRNDIFNPSSGYYINLSADATIPGIGIAQFLRGQGSFYHFTRLSPMAVFAFKARGGYTYWYNQNNSYVPVERQFFAGGANSVRGWSSRRLRYPQSQASDYPPNTYDFFQDFTGSAVILEGSFELRFRMLRPNNIEGFMADLISNIGFTFFIDWGNTFNSYLNYSYPYKWYEYITGLAVAGGAGIGYNTPVGPFRIDLGLPLYDPSAETYKTIVHRGNVMKDLKLNIGLGYSF
jgi:outer membrane protein insertion porin family